MPPPGCLPLWGREGATLVSSTECELTRNQKDLSRTKKTTNPENKKNYAVEIFAAIGSTLDLMISTRRVG